MTALLSLVFGILFVFIGKYIFKKWFNHLTVYTATWSTYVFLYELKLIKYISLSSEAWTIIILSYLCFFLGVITIFAARSSRDIDNDVFSNLGEFKFDFFADNGKTIWAVMMICGVIGLIIAVVNWVYLINKFGSIAAVLIKANLIYRLRVKGDIPEAIPYAIILAHVGVILSGIYTAYKNKFQISVLLPFIALILKDIAAVGRAGMIVGFLEFIVSFFLLRHYFSRQKSPVKSNRKNLVFTILAFLILLVVSSSVVKSFRGTIENYKGASRSLSKVTGGTVISPSVYLYLSSNVGVFSKYLDKGGEDANIGENTFLPFYNILSKFGAVRQPSMYPKGYLIPMWSNSATYLRDLHADFGYLGVFLGPYILGLLTTFFWFRFYEKGKTADYIILTHLFIITSFSVLFFVTRFATFIFSFFIVISSFPLMERIALYRSKKQDQRN